MKPFHSPRRQTGFSLLEVLITVLVLGFGLLGFALLQTMNVRFVQSSNYRTQATNLAYDLIEQMRANRIQVDWYEAASFEPGTLDTEAVCVPPTGEVGVQDNITQWQCQVIKALGSDAGATVSVDGGVVDVAVTWGDQRWDPADPDKATTFSLATEL